jgi:hypothetical protein
MFANMNLIDFIEYIIIFDNVINILKTCDNQSEKGFVFERLFDIIIKCGFCDKLPNNKYNHMIGNSNNGKMKTLQDLNSYIFQEKVISGNSSGCSDITLQNKETEEYIFISSKYPKTEKKSIDYYDIQNIIAMASTNNHIYIKYSIYLVVPNKKKLLEQRKTANETSKYITEHIIEENIMDIYDLDKYFQLFKKELIQMNNTRNLDFTELFLRNKESLNLRFHQKLITIRTNKLIDKGNKSILWGCKCRSGKTYMVGGLIGEQYNKKGKLNVMVITPAPTETIPQFTDDLFYKFKDFNNFTIHNIKNSKSLNSIKLGNSNIIIVSKQLLQRFIGENTIETIKHLPIDIIFFDENHYSGTTNISKSILDSYNGKNTVNIYLTATYNKPLKEWNINKDCQIYWDIEDEQFCKKIYKEYSENGNNLEYYIDKLKEKHGDMVHKLLDNYNMLSIYNKMPDLYLLTTLFDNERYNMIKQNIMDSKYGFSFDVLFSLNSKKSSFNYIEEIKLFLRYISGSNKEIDFKDGDKSILSRINRLASRRPFIQIWFLPSDNINNISKCLIKLIKEDNILKHYDVMCINRNNKDLAKDIKDEIIKQEKISRETNKRGLILLAGNMLSLGITIESCDIVMLMNNSISSDKVMQQMYRCMTEATLSITREPHMTELNSQEIKSHGFVIDFNISRVLNICINHQSYNNSDSIENKIKYVIENNMINIDPDMFVTNKINSDILIKKLMDIWKNDPVNNFRTLLRNLDNDYIDFDNNTQKLINKLFTKSNDTIKATLQFNDEEQELQSGQTVNKVLDDTETENNKIVKKDEEEIINISFTKDILPYIIPLTCILTIKDNNKDFVKMLEYIKENPELIDIFNDQCFIWWNNDNLIEFIEEVMLKYFDKKSNVYNVSIQFKLSLQSLIDRPKELLELINECLKPKDIEKKQNGEVFTPVDFITDKQLRDLENYWISKYNQDIWTNDTLIIYDPAVGMGNYIIAIYYKLMKGLKSKYPDENERKKHILENMLFMGELNKKNCYVVQQIFNFDNKYKLNLYQGNTLEVNIKKIFNKDKFDIIIGNPPYNEELTKTGAKPLYHKFIEYYLDKCNYMTFIIPSRWFAGGKGLDKFRDMMLNRKDIVYINHINDASSIFGNTVDIKGGVNHFLIDLQYKGLCNYNGSKIQLNKYDILIDSKYYNIIEKLSKYDNLTKIYLGRFYGIESNDKRLINDNKKDYIKCYVSQQKGFIKYIKKDDIKKEYNFYKVITARAAYEANSKFGNTFIGNLDEVHTGSYISFKVSSEKEAESLLSYMKSKLCNFMLSLRKISQDINESTCKWIPLPTLDKVWIDEEVYKYFKLTKEDINLINETNIIGYK